jgi:hypothetical protein
VIFAYARPVVVNFDADDIIVSGTRRASWPPIRGRPAYATL